MMGTAGVWEYKTIRLRQAEPQESWDQQSDGWSQQLTALGLEGWEIIQVELPYWVILRRSAQRRPEAARVRGPGAA
jgi:hypothetical protein